MSQIPQGDPRAGDLPVRFVASSKLARWPTSLFHYVPAQTDTKQQQAAITNEAMVAGPKPAANTPRKRPSSRAPRSRSKPIPYRSDGIRGQSNQTAGAARRPGAAPVGRIFAPPLLRFLAEQVAWVLNCQPHDVPVLVATRLLKPLGHPAPKGVKYFATAELLELMADRTWLAKVTNAVNQHWQKKESPPVRGHATARAGHGSGSFALLHRGNLCCQGGLAKPIAGCGHYIGLPAATGPAESRRGRRSYQPQGMCNLCGL